MLWFQVNFIPSNKRVDSAEGGSEVDMSKIDPIPDSDLPDTSPDGTRYGLRSFKTELSLSTCNENLNLVFLYASSIPVLPDTYRDVASSIWT